jgi:hypothetical protein
MRSVDSALIKIAIANENDRSLKLRHTQAHKLLSHSINTKCVAFRPLLDPSLGLWEGDRIREGRGE